MADTGLPWELPYPLPTDLVRDGADAIKDLAEAVAAGLDEAGNAGIGSNVVQTVKTDVFTTSSTTYTALTGLSASITPTSATSKVLVLVSVAAVGTSGSNSGTWRIMRDTTAISIGDAAGSRVPATAGVLTFGGEGISTHTAAFLDSPTTIAATTYSVEIRSNTANPTFVNRGQDDSDATTRTRVVSSITVIEVEA